GTVTIGYHGDKDTPVSDVLKAAKSGDGRYVIDREIARGGMGAVFRAVDCDIRREVAVKYMLDGRNDHRKVRFGDEAQITGQLEHPNIVPVHELGVDSEKRVFFTMKLVHGQSLEQVLADLRQSTPQAPNAFPLSRLLTVFVSICNALAYSHARTVIH